MKQNFDVTIIGAGAGGMVCAIRCAQRGKKVLLLEKSDRAGKKILATGNGRCNMGSVLPIEGRYNGDFPYAVLRKYPIDFQRGFFEDLGLFTVVSDGRVFPYSMQASTVNNVLRSAIERLGVTLILNEKAETVGRFGERFVVNGKYESAKLVLATGGSAMVGADCNALLESFGHTVRRSLPSLVPIIADMSGLRGLKGVRAIAKASLYVDGEEAASATDEVIFKDNGLSGTAIFALSSAYARLGGQGGKIVLDFMPEYSIDEVRAILKKIPLDGLFHKEIARNIARNSKGDTAYSVKHTEAEDVRLGSFDLAQVSCGGLVTDEFSEFTLQSKKVAGLYALGEALDVDGDCGGFNLMWAFGSALAVADDV